MDEGLRNKSGSLLCALPYAEERGLLSDEKRHVRSTLSFPDTLVPRLETIGEWGIWGEGNDL